MIVEVHVLTCDHDWVLPWTLAHYRQFADRIVVHDGGPTYQSNANGGWTSDLCEIFGAEWREWDTAGQLNDELARKLKNECWLGTDADWVIVADADEIVHFPDGPGNTLRTLRSIGAAVVKTRGYEMFSEEMPERGRQITDCIRRGAPEDEWYSKPILFSPKLVSDSGLGIGAHEARVVLRDGRVLLVRRDFPRSDPPVLMLHYKAIGTLEQVAARYDATRARLSRKNVQQNWGNVHDTGIEHARKKRAIIEAAGLVSVIP